MGMDSSLRRDDAPAHPTIDAAAPCVMVDDGAPHARHWQNIRKTCIRLTGQDCRYPFCRCLPMVEAA